ncbi:MAG: histidine kinase dimerization/phospho-acceptor domain-containing protein, partial [Planctomycetota bacterium]
MYKRLIILTVIIAIAFGGMTVLGYHAIDRWSEALRWKQFAEAAELINQDVKRKLDKFIETEENRPYYHYQFYYVHEDVTNQESIVLRRSPLAGIISNGYAYGNFQIDENANVLTANDSLLEIEGASFNNTTIHVQNHLNRRNVIEYLLPALVNLSDDSKDIKSNAKPPISQKQLGKQVEETLLAEEQAGRVKTKQTAVTAKHFVGNYKSFEPRKRPARVLEQQRGVFETNAMFNSDEAVKQLKSFENKQIQRQLSEVQAQEDSVDSDRPAQTETSRDGTHNRSPQSSLSQRIVSDRIGAVRSRSDRTESGSGTTEAQTQMQIIDNDVVDFRDSSGLNNETLQLNFGRVAQPGLLSRGTVKVHIGPFEPVITGGKEGENSIFDGQVFMVRNVRIDGRSFWQGFKFDQQKLLEEVKESAARFVGKRKGMDFKLPQTKNTVVDDEDIAWEAILDFGFGHLVVYLKETVPELIVQQASQLRSWYFSIVVIVLVAVTLGLLSLWRYANAQLKLADKKDDFISAVSHELRTPLTSIRMYSEMLEKNWIKSE